MQVANSCRETYRLPPYFCAVYFCMDSFWSMCNKCIHFWLIIFSHHSSFDRFHCVVSYILSNTAGIYCNACFFLFFYTTFNVFYWVSQVYFRADWSKYAHASKSTSTKIRFIILGTTYFFIKHECIV